MSTISILTTKCMFMQIQRQEKELITAGILELLSLKLKNAAVLNIIS
jgi:hypothetical protein